MIEFTEQITILKVAIFSVDVNREIEINFNKFHLKRLNFYLQIYPFAVPPDIIDHQSSADIVVNEGSNVSLRCKTKGFPQPSITWKRENGRPIYLNTGENG